MTCTPAATAVSRGQSASFTVAFLLLAAVVLADVIGVVECRSFLEDQHVGLVHRNIRNADTDDYSYMADGAAATGDDDEDPETESAGSNVGNAGNMPVIQTSPLNVETAEGTTVNLPCKVIDDGSLDEIALIWINGTKSIMTDSYPSTTDSRIKSGKTTDKASKNTNHILVIDEVTRWDSGSYTCRITSLPPVEITHTLRVTHPAKILSVEAIGSNGHLNTSSGKRLTVRQGEPLQLVCNVVGYPTPTVQWTKKVKLHHQQPPTASTPAQEQSQVSSAPQTQIPVVVSNTNEVRIESVSAHQHAGYYECTAHSSGLTDPTVTNSGIDLEIEYQPEVVLPRRVVNTGETYTAQIVCSVQSFPKSKVTWQKEQISADGQSSWTTIITDVPGSRFESSRSTATVNNSMAGHKYMLKVKQVQGPQDFGNYRCLAENRVGSTQSENIFLTGTPAQPRSSYVHAKSPTSTVGETVPELGWTVDSWSPLVEYQLQFRQQQDSQTSWMDVRPQPQVVDSSNGDNAGDERQYTVSYVFGGDEQHSGQNAIPSTLKHGTTYVTRIRARNVHGWSEWSTEEVFSGGMDDDQNANEINQNGGLKNDENVLKASTVSSATDLHVSYRALTTIILGATLVVVVSAC